MSNLLIYEALILFGLSVGFCQMESDTGNRIDNCTMLEIVDIPVRLTRLKTVVKSQNVFEKLFRKTKQVIEYYNATKPLVRRVCCKGYQLNDNNGLCDIPICVQGCPVDLFCIQPDKCGCLAGYTEAFNSGAGHRYCAPICQPPCLDDGNCVKASYCDAVDLSEERFAATEYPFETEYGEYPAHDNNDVDYDFSNITTSEATRLLPTECPSNFIFYHGKCRFMNLTVSEPFDCRKDSCHDIHSVCLTNGTCDCQDGYIWIDNQQELHENTTADADESKQGFCLPLATYLNQEDTTFLNYKLLILVTAALLSTLLLLTYLIVKYACKSKGRMMVEEEHLSCVYKNSPQTVI